jgi:hypothetical protein
VQVTLGWDGWVRLGTWNPVTVDVHLDRAVRGWLVVDLPQEFGAQHVRLRYPLDLPAGGRSTWRVPALLTDPRRPVRTSVVAQDGTEVASSQAVPRPELAVASVVGYIGSRPPAPPPQVAGGGRRAVARLLEASLPESPAAYASLDLLVLEGLDERNLNAGQQRALSTWVLHGGRVVVAGWLAPTAPLSGWLSAAQDLGAASDAAGLRSVDDGPMRELVPLPGGRPVVERSRTVAVWAPRGLGRVYTWAVAADRVPPDSPLWYLALPQPASVEAPPEPEGAVRAPLGPVAAGLGAYVVLWVLAVGLAGRSGWGWPALALLLAGSWALVPVLADAVRQRSFSWDATWVEVSVEQAGRAYGWASARVPYPGTYTYTLPRADAVAASGGFSELEATFLPDGVRVRARQLAGDRLRLRWEAEASAGALSVGVQDGAVVALGPVGPGAVAFWRGRQAPVEESSGTPGEWVASRWGPADPKHPALSALGWARPDAGTIVEDRPVVAAPLSDGRRGWRVVVGQTR